MDNRRLDLKKTGSGIFYNEFRIHFFFENMTRGQSVLSREILQFSILNFLVETSFSDTLVEIKLIWFTESQNFLTHLFVYRMRNYLFFLSFWIENIYAFILQIFVATYTLDDYNFRKRLSITDRTSYYFIRMMLFIIRCIARHAVMSGNFDYFIPPVSYTLHNINPPTRNISKVSTHPCDSNRETEFVDIYSFATIAIRWHLNI